MRRLGDRRFWMGFAAGIVLACLVLLPIGYYVASTLAVDNIERVIGPPSFPPELQADYDWSLRRIDGSEVRMTDFKHKAVFLHFWATWCVPCVAELPGIQRLYDRFKGDERVAFGIISQESPDIVKYYADKKGYTFPLFVTEGDQPQVFKSDTLPSTFIISPNGKIAFSLAGTARWDDKETDRFFGRLWSQEAP